MKRFLAIAGAVLLVAGAFAVRSLGDETSTLSRRIEGEPITVICATEFADHCIGLDNATIRVESAGETADRLLAAGGQLDADLWMTTSVWVDLVSGEQARLGRTATLGDAEVVARLVASIAVWEDRAAQLVTGGCAQIDWACVGANRTTTLAGGDRVQVAMPTIDSATGLVIAASQARSLTARDDFAANDFDAEVRAAAASFASGATADPLGTMRSRGPGAATVAGVIAADAGRLSSNFGTISLELQPVTADAVLVAAQGQPGASGSISQAVATSLVRSGWLQPDDGSLPDDSGLPSGSVLAAVRTLWLA